MAFFHLQITAIGRSAGRRATAAAAYRSGERVRDERNGKVYNYPRRDVLHTEIFVPSHLGGAADAWAASRERLWNAAEHAEKQSNSRVAREYQVALPHELTAAQRLALARTFAREIAERYRVAVDLAVHAPRAGGDPRNFHAHLLTTTREVKPAGLGAKTGLDRFHPHGWRSALVEGRQEFLILRERWATRVNEALREANLTIGVEHRSLASRGIDRVPRPSFPLAALKMEQRGVRSEVVQALRRQYRERLQRYNERAAQRAETAKAHARAEQASLPATESTPAPAPPRDVEEIRREAREAWLRLRPQEAEKAAAPDSGHEQPEREVPALKREIEDDLAL